VEIRAKSGIVSAEDNKQESKTEEEEYQGVLVWEEIVYSPLF